MNTSYDFKDKTFLLVDNSANGEVNRDTLFKYQQQGDLVTAEYFGGTIKYGKIIAHLVADELNMLYQCITVDNELKAGKALAQISHTDTGKIKLRLAWEWLGEKATKGVSEYIEQ